MGRRRRWPDAGGCPGRGALLEGPASSSVLMISTSIPPSSDKRGIALAIPVMPARAALANGQQAKRNQPGKGLHGRARRR
mmetsp:Transcript_40993/g.103088  ORF Transcript_40993/g.103088 Transcript_40993/m.103088 type:complete len:80 (-) Transcript_40993:53-292(-)